jgi:hypothetical protein
MNSRLLGLLFLLAVGVFSACDDDDSTPAIDLPDTYRFERNGQSTVDFSDQTIRILMAEELVAAMTDFTVSEQDLQLKYTNPPIFDPFDNAELNASDNSVREKVAASVDFYGANTVDGTAIQQQFEAWLTAQVAEVFPGEQQLASIGVAGQIADGTSTRYVNAQGLEYNELVNKGLIGALMIDQMLNNYLSPTVLDEASNRVENDNATTEDGKDYTTMEHKWDEAYGYLYGTSSNPAEPNLTIGADDNFLNKYIARVENDEDFKGIADDILEAFTIGRAAIVAGDYALRDRQAAILREEISKVIGIRVVYYLQQAKIVLEAEPVAYGTVFHDLSEAYGFIYSLQFTRLGNANAPYFTKTEVDDFLIDLLDDGPNGLWDVTPATLQNMSESVAAAFSFTVEEAGQ